MQNNNPDKEKISKVVFLDRDGVINRDSPDYIKSWEEFEFLPGSLSAMKKLTVKGYDLIVITYQSAVHRGMMSLKELERIHTRMQAAVADAGGNIKAVFFCPHTPDENCSCRKPEPGLIHQAQLRYNLDLGSACMVGDSAKDVECAQNAGCSCAILVRTGNGIEAQAILAQKHISPNHVADDLNAAADWIIAHDE